MTSEVAVGEADRALRSSWLEAIPRRHSRRRFDARPCSVAELASLAETCESFRPFDDARVMLVTEPPAGLFTGIVGSYGGVTGAPHAIAIIAREDSPAAQWHAGYTGQAVVLHATALGLDTCWIGGFFDPKIARSLASLAPGERIVAVSPVGHTAGEKNLPERLMGRMVGSATRKPLSLIAPDAGPGWPTWALTAVEAARLAPSAVNRQPWRFRLEGGGIVIARDTAAEVPRVTKALDCGIAALHAELAAEAVGGAGSWRDATSGLDVAFYRPYETQE